MSVKTTGEKAAAGQKRKAESAAGDAAAGEGREKKARRSLKKGKR